MNEPQWVNYHKHSSLSNVYTTDSPITVNDYLIELKNRYGSEPCVYSCVEHGWAGNYFKIYDDIEKFNKKNNTNIKFVFGIEAYWVKDRLTKDSSNCHIVILARNDNGRKQINKMLSVANKTGYYYKPRIDLSLIEEYLLPNDVMITTACIAFWNKYDDINDIVINLFNKFPYFYLEVQSHHTDKQKECNRHILELSKLYNIPIIAGCDSHVITEAQLADRDDLLASKKIHYEDEDGWFMDYPNYDTLFQRFQEQNILADNEIKSAIERTNVIFNFEDIVLDRSLKVPVLIPYRNKTQEERNKIFENILAAEWKEQRNDINESKLEQYQSEIKHDINEIKSCGMADYFILSYNVMKLGQSKYGGILTPSGRGSAVSMYLNKLLRLTKVDKVNSPVLMYSERFLTKERVLASKTPPDIDSNVSDREPFIQAQRELVGELGTYDLLALGTLKIKAAWKMYARAHGIDPQTANEVSEQIGLYEKAKKHADDNEIVNIHDYVDKKYYDLIDGCQSYLGIYDTRKGHPCGCLCYDGDAEADIGVILCKSESTGKEVLTAVIESGTIDAFGYLKQDYLIVDSIGLTYDIYKEIGIEPYSVNQLLKIIDNNKKVWDIYADGYTMCVNQVEQTGAIEKVKRYKPQNIYELTQFIAGIRPSFQSMYHTFEKREHFEYGIKALDSLLQDEYCSSSFIMMQEQLMKVLGFAGFPMSETYTIIKAISKKKDYVIKGAKEKFIPNFTQAILNTKETNDNQKAKEMAEQVWRIIEDSASYGFNSAHAYCMAIDSVTIAYLKSYYPLKFYKVVLQIFTNKVEKDKITRIKQEIMQRGFELKPIKFRDDNRQFSIDKEHNYIIQTMASIKDMPKNAPNALYQLGKQNITKRSELYQSLISTKEINKTAIDILFKLDYFSEFAKPNTLLYEFPIFEKYYNAKVLSKDNLNEIEYQAAQQCAKKETDKQFRDFEPMEFIKLVLSQSKPPKTTLYDKMCYEMELLGYCNLTDPNAAGDMFLVSSIEQTSYNTYITLYRLYDAWQQKYKVNKRFYTKNPLQSGDIIQVIFEEKPKWKKVDDEFVRTGETEIVLKAYRKIT